MPAKLLLTSAAEDLSLWTQALAPYALIPTHVPMFEIHTDRTLCDTVCQTPILDPCFLIVTSQYAAAAFPLTYYQQFTQIFVLGHTTAAHISGGDALSIVCPSQAINSEILVATLLRQVLPKQVVLLQGHNAHPYLLQQLVQHGFQVQQYLVYERVPRTTLPTEILESIQTNSLPYLWFTSVTASEIFWQLLPVDYRQQCFTSCILCVGSPRIAAFWKAYGPVQIADAPTRTALLSLLAREKQRQ